MVRRCEQKAEAELVDRLRDAGGLLLEREAERLEYVRRAAGRRHGAVAVLRDRRARGRRDECRRRRDVDRVRAVAAGPGRVHEVAALRPDSEHMRAHRLGATGDLGRRLALRAKGDEEAADLRRRRVSAHDLRHHLAGLVTAEVASVEQPLEGFLDHRARKFRAISRPSGVSTDSGWN